MEIVIWVVSVVVGLLIIGAFIALWRRERRLKGERKALLGVVYPRKDTEK